MSKTQFSTFISPAPHPPTPPPLPCEGAVASERDVRYVPVADFSTEVNRIRVMPGVWIPLVLSEHDNGYFGGFDGVCKAVLFRIAHRHRRHRVSFESKYFIFLRVLIPLNSSS